MRTSRRNLLVWLALIALAACLGVGPRRSATHPPGVVAAYAEDTLGALAALLGVGLPLPRASPRRVAALAMTAAGCVEPVET